MRRNFYIAVDQSSLCAGQIVSWDVVRGIRPEHGHVTENRNVPL